MRDINSKLDAKITGLFRKQAAGAKTLGELLAQKKKLEREFQAAVDRIVGKSLRMSGDLQPMIREKLSATKLPPRDRELLVRAGLITATKNVPDNPAPTQKGTK